MNMCERINYLKQALEKSRRNHHIEYNGFLSNHLDHGMVALYKMGASQKTLSQFYEEYTSKLEPKIPPQFTVTKNPNEEFYWYSLLGKEKHFTELEKFYDEQIQNEGVDSVMAQYFPKLVEGIGGEVFHGIIELGYGFEIQTDNESLAQQIISTGLAYSTYGYYSYGKPLWLIQSPSSLSQLLAQESTKSSTEFSPSQLLDTLRADPIFNEFQEHKDGFQVSMNRLVQPKYQSHLSQYDFPLPRPLYTSLEQYYLNKENFGHFRNELEILMSTFMLITEEIFHYTNRYSFFMVHAITSMRALKMIIRNLVGSMDRFPDNGIVAVNALLYYWRSLICAYITQGRPPLVKKSEPELGCKRDWDEIAKEALERIPQHPDEHVLKCVFVCREEDKEVKRDLQKEIAQNVMKVIKYENEWIF